MPAPLIAKEDVLNRLFGVFRTYGYEGATLARISDATGLGRASLYHYFPAGKGQMAREVLRVAQGWLTAHVVAPLQGPGPATRRVAEMLRNVRAGYAGGEASCVINLLGIGTADEAFHADLQATVELWLGALARLLVEAGVPAERARPVAVAAVVRIEGALVVARALGDTSVFLTALTDLASDLNAELEAAGRA